MPVAAMDATQIAAALLLADSNLKYIYEEVGLRPLIQAALATAGVTKIRRLTGWGDTPTEVREALKTQVGLDAADNVQARNDIADVIACWKDAHAQAERETALRADQRVHDGQAQPATKREGKSLKAAYDATYGGSLAREDTPGRYLLGTKLEECAEDEPVLEELSEIANREDGEEEVMIPDLSRDGILKFKKGQAKKIPIPKNSEQLRQRYRVLNNTWLMMKLRFRAKPWLNDVEPESYQTVLAKYVLGRKVADHVTRNREGHEIKPSWDLVLHYEREIRKKGYDLVIEENLPIMAAIAKACKCSETRELHFVERLIDEKATKISTAAAHKRPFEKTFERQATPIPSSGKGQRAASKVHSVNPRNNHKQICFAFNNPEGCNAKDCPRDHVCQLCLKPGHGRSECFFRPKGGGKSSSNKKGFKGRRKGGFKGSKNEKR